MFALPDIKRLEKQAEERRKADKKAKTFTCDYCDQEFAKDATFTSSQEGSDTYRPVHEEWFSPLSDKPNGILHVCPKCVAHNEENYGNPFGEDSYFTCDGCGQVNITNFSWERYDVRDDEEGTTLCMKCAAKRYLAPESDKWLASEEAIQAATKDIEALQAYGPKHLGCIGGDKKLPLGCLSFRETPEYGAEHFDWFSRMEMGGFGGDGSSEVRDCALTAFKFYSRVAVIIGEAGQFQMYMDIVVDGESRRQTRKRTRRVKTDMKAAKPLPAGCFPEFITRT